jgi:hypothetical protein
MADSPSLSDTPSFDSSFIEGVYQQFANFALVFNFPLFFSIFKILFSEAVKIKAKRHSNVFDLPRVKL